VVAAMMKFYNRRLATLAKRRCASGCYGRSNSGWRDLYDGFVPDTRIWDLFGKGLFRWWKCELANIKLGFVSPGSATEARGTATSVAEA